MSSSAIKTVVKLLEDLPEVQQDRVLEHLREYVLTIKDEQRWDEAFERTKPRLIEMARQARREVAEGKAQPLNLDDL